MLERVRHGFAIEAAFGDDLQAADVADAFVTTLAPVATEDFVCLMEGGALTTEYRGLEGLREGWTDFLGAFETISITPEEAPTARSRRRAAPSGASETAASAASSSTSTERPSCAPPAWPKR